eukprot:Ihof_evm3s93 gene=Ihof_evmTU3s93
MQIIINGLCGEVSILHANQIDTVSSVKKHVSDLWGLPVCEQRLLINGKQLDDDSLLSDSMTSCTNAQVLLRIQGGKGGFGSMLRSIGARAAQKETTNFEACRDLNGRRLRNVHDEEKMAEWLAGEEDRKRLAEEKKKMKQESVLRGPRHNFDHHKLGTESRDMKERIDEALVAACQEKRKRTETPLTNEEPVKKLKI